MNHNKLTRRRFLQLMTITLGAGVLSACGVRQPEIEFIDASYGEDNMSKKILVAYASRAGSTAGVAEAIGKTLAERGASVDVKPVDAITDLSPYDAAVIGSAIRGGKWLPEGMHFIESHQSELNKIPCAAFLVCMTMAMKNEQYRAGVAGWMAPARAILKPVREGTFAGELDFSKLPFTLDVILFKISSKFGFPTGDHRDWEAIRTWAEHINPLLK
ncbi:MAG: flavodoxin domain-containing protein [Anaerolineaceae bacterium]